MSLRSEACHHHPVTDRPFQLRTLEIGDEPAAWSAAGFVVEGNHVIVNDTTITLVGSEAGRGILRATVDGSCDNIDGMPFRGTVVPETHEPGPATRPVHPNVVVDFDHLVAMSPHMDRTVAALVAAGIDHRRTRTFEAGGHTRRQAFFWLGDVILELAGDDEAHGEGDATLWGLALTCDDLDAAADHLGDMVGRIKTAVQPGRRIATVRTGELDISVPIALMSPHPTEAGR